MMRFLTKLIPIFTVLIGSILFFYPLQIIVQKHIRPLQLKNATIHLSSGWIKQNDSIIPTISFNTGTLGGRAVTDIGNGLHKYSQYILPAGVMFSVIFSALFLLGLGIKARMENDTESLRKKIV
jgi:hypothetical protein